MAFADGKYSLAGAPYYGYCASRDVTAGKQNALFRYLDHAEDVTAISFMAAVLKG